MSEDDRAVYFPGIVRVRSRANVREDIDPRIHVHLHGNRGAGAQPEAEMTVTVSQALYLIEGLAAAVGQFCERRDIRDALVRTDPLDVS